MINSLQIKKSIYLTVTFVGLLFASYGQGTKGFNWIDLQSDKNIKLQGQLWGEEVNDRFDRLPSSHESKVRKEVWELSQNPAGIYLDFYTAADTIVLNYKYKGKESLKNMSAIGVSGMDLYVFTKNKHWVWVQGKYASFKKEDMSIVFSGVKFEEVSKYRLYFPLYNSIYDVKLGLNKNAELKQITNTSKPIIVYGTSIAQGASASRAGLAWTAILG
ncbi:MAG: hypothetical protein EOO93_29785, partial [Pedobacter sp.]